MAANRGPSEKSLANLRPFQPGQSGNPSGRPATRPYTDALRKIADPDAWAQIVWKAAEKGESWAVALIADRTEGKPSQSVLIGQEPEAAPLVVRLTTGEVLELPEGNDAPTHGGDESPQAD